MYVILSEAKDLTVGMRIYSNELKINEEKIIHIGSKVLSPDERSLALLGMTE
jgi:hypothetical protein